MVTGSVVPISVNNQLSPEPAIGLGIVIPLGSRNSNCNQFIELEEARSRLQLASEMFEMGIITEQQFLSISQQTYDIINSNV